MLSADRNILQDQHRQTLYPRPHDVRASFKDLRRIAEAFGFKLKRTSGSHHIFQHPDVPGSVNLQPSGKDAKPYQVRQLLDMIDPNGLDMIE